MELAILCHTFLRDDKMYKCINSFIEKLPYAKIYLTDGGIISAKKNQFYNELRKKGHTVLLMPFDISPAKARNIIIERIKEEFILKIDDDFYVGDKTKIWRSLELMIDNKDIDILGMGVESARVLSKFIYDLKIDENRNFFNINKNEFWDYKKYKEIKYHFCDVTPDFFIARRNIFPECNWDEKYHVGEGLHWDFFYTLKEKKKKVAYTPDSIIYHMKHDDPASALYTKLRNRKQANMIKLKKKWNIKCLNHMIQKNDMSGFGKWNGKEINKQRVYGDPITYKKAKKFLDDGNDIYDLGCGNQEFKNYIKKSKYIGVDGSADRNPDLVHDLAEDFKQVDNILLRHVLEHNDCWKIILSNVLKSFKKKLCIINFIPFGEKTNLHHKQGNIPFWQFGEDEFREFLNGYKYEDEIVKTKTGLKQDHIFYIKRK